jgi:hypothetical protein
MLLVVFRGINELPLVGCPRYARNDVQDILRLLKLQRGQNYQQSQFQNLLFYKFLPYPT